MADGPVKSIVGKGGGYRLELLANLDPRQILFVDVGGNPYLVERAERKQHVAGVYCRAAQCELLDHRAAYRRAHDERGTGGLDSHDILRLESEQFELARGRGQQRPAEPNFVGLSRSGAQLRGSQRLQVFGLRRHIVGTVESKDVLALANIIPLRNPSVVDSPGNARDNLGHTPVV